MNRLTMRLEDGQVVMGCEHCGLHNGWCSVLSCRNRLKDRLCSYEDSGLSPEEVEALKMYAMGKAVAEIKELDGISTVRLRELAQAEKDGRLVVLPCKVGDTVYQTDGVRVYESKVKTIVFDTGLFGFDDRAIGSSVFLTREAVEMALTERRKP